MEPKFNIIRDLYRSDKILKKLDSFEYSQALYAALCNNEWMPKDTMQILKSEGITISWRRAGGIIAELRGIGDYMDFYCTGGSNGFVDEGEITDEIREDLSEIGWVPK